MNEQTAAQESNHEDVQRLAYLNWEKDGSPQGRAIDYWLEAEQQLKATWPFLRQEPAPKKRTLKSRSKVAAKSKPRISIKIAATPKAAQP
jgi:hypothetical protein